MHTSGNPQQYRSPAVSREAGIWCDGRLRTIVAVILTVLMLAGVAGCGGSNSDTQASASSTESQTAASVTFSEALKEHKVWILATSDNDSFGTNSELSSVLVRTGDGIDSWKLYSVHTLNLIFWDSDALDKITVAGDTDSAGKKQFSSAAQNYGELGLKSFEGMSDDEIASYLETGYANYMAFLNRTQLKSYDVLGSEFAEQDFTTGKLDYTTDSAGDSLLGECLKFAAGSDALGYPHRFDGGIGESERAMPATKVYSSYYAGFAWDNGSNYRYFVTKVDSDQVTFAFDDITTEGLVNDD